LGFFSLITRVMASLGDDAQFTYCYSKSIFMNRSPFLKGNADHMFFAPFCINTLRI
jgi:hypothetical protein